MSFGRFRSSEQIDPQRSPRIAQPGGCTSIRYWDGPAGGFGPIGDPPERQPVFLVHGFAGADHSWWALRSALAAAGFPMVIALRHNAFRISINGVADWLVDHAERAMMMTGSTGVHLVGHSMGGLVVRVAAGSGGLAGSATTAVTIATPHHGLGLARLLPGPAARQLRPASAFLTQLDDPTEAPRTHWMNIYSTDDRVVSVNSAALPEPASGLLGARQMPVEQLQQESVGHRSILRHPRIVGHIISTLVACDDAARCRPTTDRAIDKGLSVVGRG